MSVYIVIGIGVFVFWAIYRDLKKTPLNRSDQPTHQDHRAHISVTTDHLCEPSSGTDDQDHDDWEGSFWDVSAPISISYRLRIKYQSASGKETLRTVDVRQFGNYGDTCLIIANCHLRNATRTFRVDRIKMCIDESTGELISDVNEFLHRKYLESPERSIELLLEHEYDLLRILLYVAKADGQLRQAEKVIMHEVALTLAKDSRLTESDIDHIFSNMGIPSIHAFKLAVGRIVKKGDQSAQVVLDAARKIVLTQSTVHPSELEALEYIEKRINQAC
jgi:tellurite resistance protein